MEAIGIEERKGLQIEILDAIHDFCTQNGIVYSLGYGSLLGAVRHKGYIPWDDDIDIIMLREDYNRFEALFPDILNNRYSFGTINRINEWSLPFGKVYDIRTRLTERKADVFITGVNIDVFPLDYVPNNNLLFLWNKTVFKILSCCIRVKILKVTNNTSFVKRLIAKSLKAILFFLPGVSELVGYVDKRSNRLSKTISRRVYYWPSKGHSSPIPVSWFNPITYVSFENKIYCSVNDTSGYLEAMYGPNYMIPPMEKERVSFHTNDAYWKD